MIARIWHGYTTPANADAYESLLRTEIFHAIENQKIQGFKGIQLLRKSAKNEVEFITIMWFENTESVKRFAGKEYEKAVVPDKAQQLLKRFDATSQHYEVKENLTYR